MLKAVEEKETRSIIREEKELRTKERQHMRIKCVEWS